MNKEILETVNDRTSGFYSETKEEFEAWLKGILGSKYKLPTTREKQQAWDAFWFEKY